MTRIGWMVAHGLRRLAVVSAVLLASLAFTLAGPARPVLAATITVNTATDEDTSNANCSLREAIRAANTDAAYNGCAAGSGADTIAFTIAGTALSVRTISLSNTLGALPAITTPLTVDGWSQGVFDGTAGYTGSPLIEINGTNLTATSIAGLTVDGTPANGVTIQGLTLNRFKSSLSAAIKIQNGASNVTIKGNYVGLNNAGTATAAATPNNNSFGILVTDVATTSVAIGGTTAADRNVISGSNGAGTNRGTGISIQNGANGVTITGNYIGLRADGTAAVANSNVGILVTDATTTNVAIGGSTAGERNVISGNTSGGVRVQGGASQVTIRGNYVGLNAAGTAAVSNGTAGINVTGAGTGHVTIGGTSAGERNIVSGNSSIGIAAQTNASHVTIQGNYVGTNPAGTSAIANSNGIVALSATDTTVGGTAAGAGNLVSGNTSSGILVSGTLTNTVVQGNWVGTDASGTAIITSGGTGIGYSAAGGSGATFGGTSAAARNVIVGVTTGINLSTGLVTNTTIQGNYVGVMPDGTTAAGNGTGIKMIGSTGIMIGGTASGAGNIIANSTGSTATTGKGIIITGVGGASVLIRGNSIYNNGTGTTAPHLGIDLSDDGVTANDSGDADTGPNGLLNTPVLDSAGVGGGITRVTGTLNAVANTTYQIDAYANDSCDPSGNGEGQTYLGSGSVTTDGSGTGSFALVNLAAVTAGQAITATTSDTTLGTTSEFSACRGLTTPAITVSPTSGLVTSEAGGTATFTVQLTLVPNAPVTIPVSSSDTDEGTVSPSSLTFQPDLTGLAAQTVTVTGVDDLIKDGDTAYSIRLGPVAGGDGAYSGADPADVQVTNLDDEGTPALSVADTQVTEGNSGTASLGFTVTLSPGTLETVTVQYATGSGTATSGASCGAGVDYVAASGTLTFAATETSKQILITICGDTAHETDETVPLTLATPTNATISRASATGTVRNDDGPPALSVSDPNVTEGDGSTATLAFTVNLGPASGQAVTVQYATADGTATGDVACSGGADYQATGGMLTFAPGETEKTVNVAVCGDTEVEGDETVLLNLGGPSGATIADDQGRGTITADDLGGVIAFSAATATVRESDRGITLTVQRAAIQPVGTRSGAPGARRPGGGLRTAALPAVTVQYATADGTARDGRDYTAVGGTLSFRLNETSRTVTVPIREDSDTEPPETFTVTLSNPTGGATVGSPSTVSVTIVDTSLPAPPPPSRNDADPSGRNADPKDGKDPHLTEEQRRQREHTNRGNRDDVATEGNVIEVHRDETPPYIVLANRDGNVRVNLLCGGQCPTIRAGDYVEIDGEKQHEGLYDAEQVTVVR